MSTLPLLIAVGVFALAATSKSATEKPIMREDDTPIPRPDFVAIRAMIRAEATKQGVPPEIALATARVESGFDPTREGDLQWHTKTARFDRVVSDQSPWKRQPELWHSYGLFQLLAPYHVEPNEDPRVLLDPRVNTERGVRTLKRLLLVHHGDTDRMRLYYTGAHASDAATQARVLAKWNKALSTERALKG